MAAEMGANMRVELSRFKVKPGKSTRVDEWRRMLNDRMSEIIPILDREEMKLEVIFREVIGEEEYLYWFTVQGEEGEPVQTSPHDVDKKHIAFHEECIEHEYGMRDAQAQAIMVPEVVARSMGWKNPPASRVGFERREIIHRPNSAATRG
jgi:hypothetical protein